MVHLTDGRMERESVAQRRLENKPKKLVPITLLTGFLGSGKTTLVQHILQNKDGLKVGVVVNDLAATNVDGKLLDSGADADSTTIQLENGCACCSLGNGIFSALQSLQRAASRRGQVWDKIVIELSGVAEPQNIIEKFHAARRMIVMKQVYLHNVVCVMDSNTFPAIFDDGHGKGRGRREGEGGRGGSGTEDGNCAAKGTVVATSPPPVPPQGPPKPNAAAAEPKLEHLVQLLMQQLECADLVLLNKADITPVSDMDRLKSLIPHLSAQAVAITTSNSCLPLTTVFDTVKRASRKSESEVSLLTRHLDAVLSVKTGSRHGDGDGDGDDDGDGDGDGDGGQGSDTREHSHDHGHATHASHVHSGQHDACDQCDSHDHSHGHSHDHSHGHSHSHSHDHSHGHGHEHEQANGPEHSRFGIRSFVYRRSQPFDWPSLWLLLSSALPVRIMKTSIKTDTAHTATDSSSGGEASGAFASLVRSKGFIWLAPHSGAGKGANGAGDPVCYYWSHAGSHFELSALGPWKDFAASTGSNSGGGDSGGGACQEVVFIGIDMQEQQIISSLDACLV